MSTYNPNQRKLFWFYSSADYDSKLAYIGDDFNRIRKNVRIVDDGYKMKWGGFLTNIEFKLFMKIMKNNKHALLNRLHKKLGEVCTIKILYGDVIELKK